MNRMILFISFLAFTFGNVYSLDERLEKIINKAKADAAKIASNETLNEKQKKQKLILNKKVFKRKVKKLKVFYTTRYKFEKSKEIKAYLSECDSVDLLEDVQIAKSESEKTEAVKDKSESKETVVDLSKINEDEKKSDKAISNEKLSYLKNYKAPKGNKKGLTLKEYKSLSPKRKEHWVKKLVHKDDKGFYTVTKGRYTVKSRISAEYSLEKAVFMDEYYSAFEKLFKGDFANKSTPVLYVGKNQADYFRILSEMGINAPAWSAGLYSSRKKALFGYQGNGDFVKDVLYHEGAHQLLHFYTNRSILPWFNEGLATNIETWSPSIEPRANLFEAPLKTDRLITLERYESSTGFSKKDFYRIIKLDGFQWNSSNSPTINYATAWSVVNFLLNTDQGRMEFNRILKGYMKGKDIFKIYSEVELEKFANKWLEDLKGRQIPMHKTMKPIYKEFNVWASGGTIDAGQIKENIYKMENNGLTSTNEGRYLQTLVMMINGKHETVLSTLNEQLGIFKSFPFIYSSIAYCYKQLGNENEFVRYFKKAKKANHEDILLDRMVK